MRKRGLTAGERDLWRRVVRDVAPLEKPKLKPANPVEEPPAREASVAPSRPNKHRGVVTQPAASSVAPAPRPCVFSAGDPRIERHVRRGRRTIDATFDLHGHTQASARGALLGFLLEARARGHRCVLVITGKGAPGSAGMAGRPSRGVLKTRLQEWLNEPDFRRHVIRASQSDPRHGGGGAFYVFLKK